MTSTNELIASLSADAKTIRPVRSPSYWSLRLGGVLLGYALVCQLILGLRPDVMTQMMRPFFAIEIVMLAGLVATGAVACILAMYPDAYQRGGWLKFPYVLFLLLVGLMAGQLLMPQDARMVVPAPGAHAMECALCIASVALIPSAVIFSLLRKGASVRQFQAGMLAVLAASAIGCLTLRLSEPNDSLVHLVSWHYLPTVAFAAVGAWLGKCLLRW